MKSIKSFFIAILACLFVPANAQIGYQVSLLNSATGEPRANETVSVQVEITNSKGEVICSETKSATANEFGVLSLQIGNSSTFANVDWSKLPFYVSATVDGIMIGKSQILNVPVAEAARTLVNVDPDLICKTWNCVLTCGDQECGSIDLTLRSNNTFTCSLSDDFVGTCSGSYYLLGNVIFLCVKKISGEIPIMPSSVVYEDNAIHGNFAAGYGSRILH